MIDRPLLRNDPEEVGAWQIRSRLGLGATGVVFGGVGPLGRSVAIKVLRPDAATDPNYRARFRAEVRALAAVESPHVANLIDADVDADQPYHVTRLVEGPNLRDHVDQFGPLRGEDLVAFAHDLAEGVAAVHRAGFVHRDLKPENVVMGPDGPVLVDFGLASPHDMTEMTQIAAESGTPGWIAPELISGADAGLASDVFVWAALVAYAGSGLAPFGNGAPVTMMYRIVHEEPSLDELDPVAETAVRSGLIKDPTRRPSLGQLCHLMGTPVLERVA